MASVVVKANFVLDTQQLLESLEPLDISELESLYQDIGRLLARRKSDRLASPLFSVVEDSVEEINLPIVEKLMPKSIVLNGDSVQL